MLQLLVLLSALSMPLVAWASQRGVFGPDNGTISDRFPTLLVADGYAFSIWGVIFLLDLVAAVWLLRGRPVPDREGRRDSHRCHWLVVAGFGLTASWMIVFSQQWFALALAVIWGALVCLLWALMLLARAVPRGAQSWLVVFPLALHAGWLSLAAFLDTAQTVVATQMLPTQDQLPWTLVLWALAALLLLVANARLHAPGTGPAALGYALAAIWGLVGVHVKQTASPMTGSDGSAWIALGLAAVLAAQTLWLRMRPSGPMGPAGPAGPAGTSGPSAGVTPGGARPSRRTDGPTPPPTAAAPGHRP